MLTSSSLGDELIEFDGLKTQDYLKMRSPHVTGSTIDSMLSEVISDEVIPETKEEVINSSQSKLIEKY